MSWPESKMVQQKRNLPLNKWGVYPKKFLEKVFYIWIKLEIETVFVFLCPLINELEYMQLVQKHINTNTFSSILQVPAFPFRHFVRQNLTIYKTCASARHKSGCAHSHPRGDGGNGLTRHQKLYALLHGNWKKAPALLKVAPGPISEAPLITMCLWHSIKEVWTTTDTDLGSFFLMTFFCYVNIFNTYVHYACFSKN